MALQIMKINVSATSDVEVNPIVQRFFYVTTAETDAGDTLTIDATDFFDDAGNEVTDLPALVTNNSFVNVYVNGVLQMEDISTYTSGGTGVGSLAILVPTQGAPIQENTAIVIEVVNYDPITTITIET